MTVDVERLMGDFFRGRSEITDLVGDRIYTVLPSKPTFPLVRITLLGGQPRYTIPLWIDDAFIQIDAYGGPKVMARQIIDAARDLLVTPVFRSVHPLGVVANVTFGQLAYIPDDVYDPPKPRYVAEASVLTHPV